MPRKRFVGDTVTLHELVVEEVPPLDGYTFRACRIIGPGVIWLGDKGDLMIGGCHFDDTLTLHERWGAEPTDVRFTKSSFLQCEFSGVGFAGRPERLNEFRDGIES